MGTGAEQCPGAGTPPLQHGRTPLRFPPDARIRSGTDFQACFAARQRLSGRYFSCSWRAAEGDGARLGLAVSRRVDKRATRRNRLKRLIRESFRARRPALPALDIVITPRTEAAAASVEVLQADLDRLWARLLELPPSATQGTMPRAPAAPGADPVTSAMPPPTC